MAHFLFALALVTLSAVYFGYDKSWLHGSRTVRRIFWASLSALLSWWLVFALRSLDVHGSEGLVFVFTAVMAASLVEDKVQSSLFMTPFRSPEAQQLTGTPEAQGKAELLMAVISSINKWQGYTVGASRVVTYVAGSLSKHRKIIHEVLSGLNQSDLNYVLVHINTAALFEVAGPLTMDMLTSPRQRLPEITTLSRAAMLDALQKIGMRYRPARQRWATEILKATKGQDLTRLKAYVDDGGDYHTIYKLCHSDLQGAAQQEVVQHIKAEGCALYEKHARMQPNGLPGVALKVVSDIDDTLMCSGGHYPAGRDTRYPHNCVYPGILAFYNELDVGHVQRIEDGRERLQAERASAHGSPVTSPRLGPGWAPRAALPVHVEGAARRVWHPRDAPAVQERQGSAAGSVDGPHLALGPREIPLSQVQIGRDAVGPDGKASPMTSEHAASMASSHAEDQRGRQMWGSRDGRSSRAAEESRLSLGGASGTLEAGPSTPFGAATHQLPGMTPPIVGRQLMKADSMGESASVASSELPERPVGQNGHPAWAPRRPPALKLSSYNSMHDSPADFDKLNDAHGKAAGSGAGAGGGTDVHVASGDATGDCLMDAIAGPSDIPAGDNGPTAGGEARLNEPNLGEQPGGGLGAVVTALKTGAANVAKDAPDAPSSSAQQAQQAQPGEGRAPRGAQEARQSASGDAQQGGLPPRGAMHAKAGPSHRLGGESPRIANISECAPLETPLDSFMSNDGGPSSGPGRHQRDDGADWPPPMTNAGRRRLNRPIMGGEGHAPPKSRWQNRPHQKFVHLVFLSARPESFKGLTEALSLRKIFRPLVRRGEMNGYPVLLLGSLRAGPKALWDYATGSRPPQDNPKTLNTQLYIQLYQKKLARFRQFADLYPECYWVFVGDNGQGDVLLAEKLNRVLTKPDGRCSLVATFIHRMVPTLDTLSSLRSRKSNKAAWLAAWRDHNIFFNRTPIGMAAQAYTLGLIDETGLQHVCMEAATDLRRARARYAIDSVDWAKCVRQLNKDIKAANAFLSDELKVTMLRLPEGGALATLGGRMSGYESDASVLGGFSTASLPGANDCESEVSSVRGMSPVRGGSPRHPHRMTFGGMTSYGGGYGGGYESDVSSFSYAGHA